MSPRNMWGTECEIEEEYDVFTLTEGFGGGVPPNMDEATSLETVAIELSRIRRQLEDDPDQEP